MINLGSIGKGYAIDRAVDVIRGHWWPTSALVHGGRSSLFALGSPPGRFGGRWEIALRNPFAPSRRWACCGCGTGGWGPRGRRSSSSRRTGGSTATSSTRGPASPPTGPASVTVLAPTAAEADALSTAFYLLGAEAAAAYVGEPPRGRRSIVEDGPADGRPGRDLRPGPRIS